MNNSILKNDFKNIHTFNDGEDMVFSFRFGNSVYEEVFSNGRYMSAGWNTAGYTQNVLDGINTRLNPDEFSSPQSFDVEANGCTLTYDWTLENFEVNEEKLENGCEVLHPVLTLSNKLMPLEVQVHTVLDGTSVMTRYIKVTNTGEKAINISGISPMCGAMECVDSFADFVESGSSEELYSLGYFESASWGNEGLFKWHKLPTARYGICGRYKEDVFRHPMFMLKNNALGTFFFCQLAWTGGYEITFDLKDNYYKTKKARLEFNIAIDSQKPLTVLESGEAYVSPGVHITAINGSLDDAVNMMHSHTRKSVFTLPEGDAASKGLVEMGMGPERVMDFDAAKHFIDTAAMVGAEAYVIDAGWYLPGGKEVSGWHDGTGNWYADSEKYGKDFAEIRDYAASKGLIFGLWMEPESLGSKAHILESHPEWRAVRYNGKDSRLIDMTNPEAAAWVESEICRIIEEYKIGLFRLDFNVDKDDYFIRITKDGRVCSGVCSYYDATCAMFRRLREKYPDVIFENCASGGRRTTLDFVCNFTHTWVTDWQIAPRSVAITNGMTMVLPPEKVDGLVGGMNSHTKASLDFQVRRCIFGRPTANTFNCVGSEFNPGQIEFVRHTFDLYKEYIRPYADSGRIFHHTPECFGNQPKGSMILERSSEDGVFGAIGIFSLCDSKQEFVSVYPKGVDISKNYEVMFDNSGLKTVLSGYDMVQNGIRVNMGCPLGSELILYKEVQHKN